MIIYNNKKEFLGIDKDSLKSLGYSSLAELQSEAADFGDLFVKTPGHVHNFVHVHWIDFVLCEDDRNACKAIIHAKNKNLNCILEIKTIYLTSSPNSKSYIINLNNLRNLSSNETNGISSELQTRAVPVPAIIIEEEIEEEIIIEDNIIIDKSELKKQKIINDPYETADDSSLDSYELSQEQLDEIGEPDVIAPTELEPAIEIDLDEPKERSKQVEEKTIEKDINPDFDINKTAEILEMDVATIEDFINDFISQAKEFKSKLYDSVTQEDLIILKSLSHQLKGVAANLRIHHCQDILIKINQADDFDSSEADLDIFYKLINKLAGEEEVAEEILEVPTQIEEPEEIITPKETIQEIVEIEEDDYILEADDSLSSEKKSEHKTNSMEIENDDDYILEIEDTLVSEPKSKNRTDSLEIESNDIPDIDDFDSLDLEQDKLLEEQNDISEIEEDKLVPLYDKTKIAGEIGLDEQSFNELFQDYQNETKDLISVIKVSIDTDSSANWKYAAIQLKGMSDNMRINNFTSELTTLISTNDKDDAQNALKKIEILLSQIISTKD